MVKRIFNQIPITSLQNNNRYVRQNTGKRTRLSTIVLTRKNNLRKIQYKTFGQTKSLD